MPGLQEYKCPCCGGPISFESSIQKMKCPYCDTEFDVGSLSHESFLYANQTRTARPLSGSSYSSGNRSRSVYSGYSVHRGTSRHRSGRI